MRRMFIPAVVAGALLLILLCLSLFNFTWMTGSPAGHYILSQGCVRVWIHREGDATGLPTGAGEVMWTGSNLNWRPVFDTASVLWFVPNVPTLPGTTPLARKLVGIGIVVPLLYPLALAAAAAGLSWPAYRRHRRHKRGACTACGYSLAGLGPIGKCPECGTAAPEPRRGTGN